MSAEFRTIDRDTPMLMPASIQEWLPEQHLARFVVEVVDQLDLSELPSRYGGGGKQAYHPALLVALLFYGYASGVFSSRKLEQATYESVAFRYISADRHPDHDTIASFRKRFLPELEGLFRQILVLASTMGVLRLGSVSLDGSKIQGNTSKHKAMSWGHANELEKQLEQEVQQLLELAERADGESEAQPALDIPEELQRREQRLAAIEDAKDKIAERAQERYEAEQAEYERKLEQRREREAATGKKPGGRPPQEPEAGPQDKDQVNFTDEQSRIMPAGGGEFVQGYNAQAAVEHDSYLVVGNHVSQATNDKREVEPALNELAKVAEQLGTPQVMVADAGYHSKENVERCERPGIEPYIAGGREHHNQPLAQRMQAPPGCPADADAVTAMQYRLRTAEGKAIYSKRKSTVETVFGVIKEVLGFRRFHLRGLQAVRGEWNLVCTAWNLKRLYVLAG
ncbi:MAG: IS1182 family transposase [Spirochaetaceae bacterium]|nr:IS1182 family transposase [Spirochaetaceae bacterium]